MNLINPLKVLAATIGLGLLTWSIWKPHDEDIQSRDLDYWKSLDTL